MVREKMRKTFLRNMKTIGKMRINCDELRWRTSFGELKLKGVRVVPDRNEIKGDFVSRGNHSNPCIVRKGNVARVKTSENPE